jgi:hypothetical protein
VYDLYVNDKASTPNLGKGVNPPLYHIKQVGFQRHLSCTKKVFNKFVNLQSTGAVFTTLHFLFFFFKVLPGEQNRDILLIFFPYADELQPPPPPSFSL